MRHETLDHIRVRTVMENAVSHPQGVTGTPCRRQKIAVAVYPQPGKSWVTLSMAGVAVTFRQRLGYASAGYNAGCLGSVTRAVTVN